LGSGAPEGFVYYVAKFQAPANNEEPVDMGAITYSVTCNDITEVYTSGSIQCDAAVEMIRKDPSVTPDTGEYRDVGSGYIVEIVDVNAETFNGSNIDDSSIPTMNYLPKGTVDYGSQGVYYNSSARRYYYLLRCGVRVYRANDNKPLGMEYVVDCYNGKLPDHNEINVASFEVKDHFTYLTLDCLWKAPFFFDEEPQAYHSDNWERFVLEAYTAGYVDITFCYATVFTGELEIPEEHPLFSKAEIIQNEADYTLRLHLKEPGKFYGWNAVYNEQDQLVFQFLNPIKVEQADNAYGADLTGLKIMVDVGHGGQDPGACYWDSQGHYWEESERNLYLAELVKKELESIGATVVMNRESEERTVTRTERIAFLIQESPDFCICIHHNADPSVYTTGYESWYFTAFSHNAAVHIGQTNLENGVYSRSNLSWHYYFMARQTACPIVLAENGYMSNKKEMDLIADPVAMQKKAEAIVQGIVNFYLEDNGHTVTYKTE
jgi:N-acetylmuramoyl-L-alanine amidase